MIKMRTILAIALVGLGMATSAIENPTMNIIPLGAEKAVVTVLNDRPVFYEISFRAANGDLVYYKKTTNPSVDFRQVYDVKNLEEGNYTVSLRVNDTKVINKLEVSDSGIVIGDQKILLAPYFSFKDNALKFSYLNFEEESLTLVIYGSDGLVFESDLGRDFNITHGYDLSKLEKGSYRVVLSSYSSHYTYDLEK